MPYQITPYSYSQARKLNVEIRPSTSKNKKVDVFSHGVKVCSIGDIRYKDYPTYLQEDKKLAEERRRLYKLRHKTDSQQVGSKGYYASLILW